MKIIYIGGWGRSGSSLLANILGSHSAAVSVGELRYLWDRGMAQDKRCGCGEAFGACTFWRRTLEQAGIESALSLARQQSRSVASSATLRQIIAMLTRRIHRYRRQRTAELDRLYALYRAAAESASVDTLIDASKTPPYAINLIDQPDIDLYFIHLVRDPRAVAHSWTRTRPTHEISGELLPRYGGFKCALYWSVFNLLGRWFRRRRHVNYLLVNYETFCEQPRDTIDRILRHCRMDPGGVTWHDAETVEVAAQHSISGNPSRFDTGPVRIKPDDEWRKAMPPARRLLVTVLCAPLLRLFGYSAGHAHRPRRSCDPAGTIDPQA